MLQFNELDLIKYAREGNLEVVKYLQEAVEKI